MAPFGMALFKEALRLTTRFSAKEAPITGKIGSRWRDRGLIQFFDAMGLKTGDMINPEFKIAD